MSTSLKLHYTLFFKFSSLCLEHFQSPPILPLSPNSQPRPCLQKTEVRSLAAVQTGVQKSVLENKSELEPAASSGSQSFAT